jgi:pyruvate/2-oxoglutarate dehydrogenase complex dihydrolipoamide acyltransferase (E2) component
MPDLPLHAPFAGTVILIARNADDRVTTGEALVVLEAMKMEHEIPAEVDGVVRSLEVAVGDNVDEGQRLAVLAQGETAEPRQEPDTSGAPASRDDLVDSGSFVEYGPLMFAAQERRRPREELIERTPADGLIAGTATIDGAATIRRRTGCSSSPSVGVCRSCCSPKAAAGVRATSTGRSSPASTAARSICSRSSAAWSRS